MVLRNIVKSGKVLCDIFDVTIPLMKRMVNKIYVDVILPPVLARKI